MDFELVSDYQPTGDQPEAIAELVRSIRSHTPHNTLLGVTGSGKTFTVANVIAQLNRPTLVLSHNKTLAAQLYGEFKNFFPNNAVEYFVSYYDYYQPEAYLPSSDTYIEKDLSINEEIEKLRLSATSALLSGRRDVIVVSSVSCLYGIGNPADFHATSVHIRTGEVISRKVFMYRLVEALYTRTESILTPATFRVNGDVIDIMQAFGDTTIRVMFFDDEIEQIQRIDAASGQRLEVLDSVTIFPANLFVTTKERIDSAVRQIQLDLGKRIAFYEREGRVVEAKRIKQRVEYDLEMIKELGYCSGIENYSRYFDGRSEGSRPFCLLDYFPEDYLMVIDESHVTLPQVRAMYGGDRARKVNLVEYGFRLPAAIDNRPLRFEEFESLVGTSIYVSATPADYELIKSEGAVVEQLIRPTGLVDPPLQVKVTDNQIDDLMEEIDARVRRGDKVLVTTLTKRMAEELSRYFDRVGVRNRYIHSDIETLERVQILDDLRAGSFDVLVGVNLLREGLDLPEVGLVAIMDAREQILAVRKVLPREVPLRLDGHAHYHMIPVVFDAMMDVIREEDLPVSYIRIPREYLRLYLPHFFQLRDLSAINLLKVAILNLLSGMARLKYRKELEPMEKKLFLGVALSGRMYYENLKVFFPQARKLAEKKGWDLEILGHPGGVSEPEDMAQITCEDDRIFLTSPLRNREKSMFLMHL